MQIYKYTNERFDISTRRITNEKKIENVFDELLLYRYYCEYAFTYQ